MIRIVLKVYLMKLITGSKIEINSSCKDSEIAWCSDLSKKAPCREYRDLHSW